MKEHVFTLMLNESPDNEKANEMYGVFNDGTISTSAGVPKIEFHREAASLEMAIRSAIADVHSSGLVVRRVELLPNSVLHAS